MPRGGQSDNPDVAAAELATFQCVERGHLEQAAATVAEFEARQPVPRGMGVDWRNRNLDRDVFALEAIMHDCIEIVAGCNENALRAVRLGAAVAFLWGRCPPRRIWLRRDLDTGTDATADEMALSLVMHAFSRLQWLGEEQARCIRAGASRLDSEIIARERAARPSAASSSTHQATGLDTAHAR